MNKKSNLGNKYRPCLGKKRKNKGNIMALRKPKTIVVAEEVSYFYIYLYINIYYGQVRHTNMYYYIF